MARSSFIRVAVPAYQFAADRLKWPSLSQQETSIMLLTLDIGNTEITVGLFQDRELEAHWRLTTNPDRTPDEGGSAIGGFLVQSGHSPNEVRAVCLASVAPATTQSVVEGVTLATGCTGVSVD